jgi:hypothetical protein
LSPKGLDSAEQKADIKQGALTLICSPPHPWHLAINMKADLQEVMNMLRKLQGAIDFGNAPMAEREELAGDVTEIMDALFEVMKKLPDK